MILSSADFIFFVFYDNIVLHTGVCSDANGVHSMGFHN